MAGPLGVSHLLLFSRSSTGNTNLRIALTPRGPTLHFRVEKYSLAKDVMKAMKHPKSGGKEYQNPPLLVMNNFMSPTPADGTEPAVPKHLETLTTSVFQSLFPAISPQTTPLSSIRRVLLLNREPPMQNADGRERPDSGSYTINVRHYVITTKRTGLPKSIRRINAAEKMLNQRKNRQVLPNLGKLEDVADYILDPSAAAGGFTSGSESEAETDAEVEVLETSARKVLSKRKREALERSGQQPSRPAKSVVEKRAVKLTELGPRMKLRMTKVEEGVCNGKVMWHEYVNKSREEVKEMDQAWEKRKKEKEERKRIQKENIERKRQQKGGKDQKEGEDDYEEDEWLSEDLSDDGMDNNIANNEDIEVDEPDKVTTQ
ncbi:MAG: hypothetical protein LQ340_006994 [Diploschistes diacapsis]|nr:MAG: hypothetical protein LQ340_006994 [Diploschistes diacapsis]